MRKLTPSTSNQSQVPGIDGLGELRANSTCDCGPEHTWPCACENCEGCTQDHAHGLVMSCDNCGHAGSNEHGWPTWQLQPDGQVFCMQCCNTNPAIEQEPTSTLEHRQREIPPCL